MVFQERGELVRVIECVVEQEILPTEELTVERMTIDTTAGLS